MRIFGVINVLSDNRRLGNAFATRRKFRSGDDGEPPNHQPPNTPEPVCWNSQYIAMDVWDSVYYTVGTHWWSEIIKCFAWFISRCKFTYCSACNSNRNITLLSRMNTEIVTTVWWVNRFRRTDNVSCVIKRFVYLLFCDYCMCVGEVAHLFLFQVHV